MLAFLESHWPSISIVLLLTLLTALFFMPSIAGMFSIAMLVLSVGMATMFIIRRQLQTYHANNIDRAEMIRNIAVEIIGLVLTIALAVFIVQTAMATMSVPTDRTGIIIAIAVSILIGLVIGWLVKVTWGRLTIAKSK